MRQSVRLGSAALLACAVVALISGPAYGALVQPSVPATPALPVPTLPVPETSVPTVPVPTVSMTTLPLPTLPGQGSFAQTFRVAVSRS